MHDTQRTWPERLGTDWHKDDRQQHVNFGELKRKENITTYFPWFNYMFQAMGFAPTTTPLPASALKKIIYTRNQ